MSTLSDMKQKDLYAQDIFRLIEGVIKANDDRHILTEVQEYVLTNELLGIKNKNHNTMLPGLFQALIESKFNSSVWISGYFGSGKSHLLKILSLVLQNKEINGQKCATIFAGKAKDDFELEKNILKVASIPTESILFNIAAKADGINSMGTTIDPVLSIFLKVFNDHLGYDPNNPDIAEIERHLDSINKYTHFKEEYLKRFDKSWEEGRKAIYLNQHELAEIYGEIKSITTDDANRFIENQINNYKLDIDGFANLVANYIGNKAPGFRLIFCVDEVGQFIAENVNRMLSLQTIAESLSFITKGQSFMIVTSQNDLDATIGDMTAKQKHDFSRIQGRFANKIPLTSANADEVIQKRLLKKKEEAEVLLTSRLQKEINNIKTLLKFDGDVRQYKAIKDENHLVNTYPFLPYQFDLFQESIMALSKHNAFIGSQQSVGERSMLGVFQQVAKTYADENIDQIVSFGHMYDGIKDVLQGNIQSDIILADKNLESTLAKEALKTLFLVKYVPGFQATLNNIAILLLPKFEVNLGEFHNQVQEALNLLEHQTYIRRIVGDKYEYLTNQEKDIENEIKSTEIDPGAPGQLLASYLFDDIIGDAKVKLDGTTQIYTYGKKLDDNLIGSDKDFYLNFITPLNPNMNARENIAMFSMLNPRDLIVYLPEDKKLYNELRLIRKTESYIQTTRATTSDPGKERILSEKAHQNEDRKRSVVAHLKEYISEANMYFNGTALKDISNTNPKTRVSLGMQQLIRTIYPDLAMLPADYNEADLLKVIQTNDDILLKSDLHESEVTVLNRINLSRSNHDRTTIKSLIDHFSGGSYGWPQVAVLYIIAKLYKRNKISIKQDSNVLEGNAVLAALQKTPQYSSTIVDPEEEVDTTQLQKLKRFHQEYFTAPNLGSDPKEVSRLFKLRLVKEVEDLNVLYNQRHQFKFLENIGEPLHRLKQLAEKDHIYFFTALDKYQDEVLDDKENVLEPIKKFMDGAQRGILEDIQLYRKSHSANFEYIDKANLDVLDLAAEDPAPYKGNIMQQAKAALEKIRQDITERQKIERTEAEEEIRHAIQKLQSAIEFAKLDEDKKKALVQPFEQAIQNIQKEVYIGNIRNQAQRTTQDLYQKQLGLLYKLAVPSITNASGTGDTQSAPSIIRRDSIKIPFKKPALETRQDVDEYVTALKEQLMKLIEKNNKISL